MRTADIGSYISKLFDNGFLVTLSAVGAFIYRFFFPEPPYLASAAAVLGIMIVDLLTRLWALSRAHGGFKTACVEHIINSHSFGKGTMDKLIVFGIVMIICGLAYRLTLVGTISTWFMQITFGLMFLRDVLSIIENLVYAGVKGLGPLKKLVCKKINELCDDTTAADNITSKPKEEKPEEPAPSTTTDSSSNENTNKL